VATEFESERERRLKPEAADPGDGGPSDRLDELDGQQLLIVQLAQLGEYARHLATARVDWLRAGVRQKARRFVTVVFCVIVALASAILAVALTVDGIARGLTVLLGGRVWAGRLLGGLLVLGLLAAGGWAAAAWSARKARAATVAKYEARKARQRARFGRNVGEGENGKARA